MATLKEIRTQFVKLSGRYDLVVDTVDYADAGADWYIRAGQRMLDKLAGFPKDLGRRFDTVSAGTYYTTFSGCRAVKEVWAANSTSRWQLEFLDTVTFRNNYPGPYGSITSGKTTYFTKAHLRGIPDFGPVDALSGYASEISPDTSQLATTGIVFMPPTEEEIQIEVWGLFDSPTLSNNSDVNFWSVNHEDALAFAALYKLEVSYRNRQGANDWLTEIMRLVVDIDKDEVEEEANSAEEMSG